MRRLNRFADDRGSASLEFITAGTILLVPLVYLVVLLASLQAASFAVEGAARQAARVFVESSTEADAAARVDRAVQFALADYGVASAATVSVSCRPIAAQCLTRHGFVTVSVDLAVPLPLIPAIVGLSAPPSIPLHASATQQVSRFWGNR